MKQRRLKDGRALAVHDNGGLRKVCGCPRRAWPKCHHPWHFSFKWAGKHHRLSLDRQLGKHVSTKADARAEADKLKIAIREGQFVARGTAVATAVTVAPEQQTLAAFGAIFIRQCPIRSGKNKGHARGLDDRSRMNQLVALPGADGEPLGPRSIGSLTVADFEAALRALRDRQRSANTQNKYLQTILLMQSFGRRKGYLPRPWVEDRAETDLQRTKGAERHRRLEPGEDDALIREADPRLKHLIVGALETACRLGELLSLRWRDIGPRLLHVRDSKTGAGRHVPISARLRAVLTMRQTAPTGTSWPADAFVFGDGIGQRVGAPDRAWESCVLRAHGVKPTRTKTKALTADARAVYQRIDLTFHDLRHEAGSRLLEAGMPLHEVSVMLGHANIATTSRYLNAKAHGLMASMQRIDVARAAALQAVANQTTGEDRPVSNDGATVIAQPSIN